MKKTERKPRPTSGRQSPRSTASLPAVSSETSQSLQDIKALIELVAEKQITDFELERGDFRLRIHRGTKSAEVVTPQVIVQSAPAAAPLAVAPSVAVPVAAAQPAAPVAAPEEDLHIITSPIVGTFYRAPSPTADAFVKMGDSIEKGKTICIIEAMKLMNEITAEVSGTVAKMFVENGQPVEFGQPLFGIKL